MKITKKVTESFEVSLTEDDIFAAIAEYAERKAKTAVRPADVSIGHDHGKLSATIRTTRTKVPKKSKNGPTPPALVQRELVAVDGEF